MEINTIEALQAAFSFEGAVEPIGIESSFADLASSLMNHFAIRKGDRYYRFVEIEFYHNLTDGGSSITYPRLAEACEYFFHKSGVDLTFKSTRDRFGGILIRSLACEDRFINGPLCVVDELFDQFTALKAPDNFPVLVQHDFEKQISPVPCSRWHIPGDKKYRFVWPSTAWPKPKRDYQAYPWDSKGALK